MNSILVSALTALDVFMCVLVVVAACEYLRKVRPVDQPLLSIAFYMAAIGGFGAFITALQGHWVNPWSGAPCWGGCLCLGPSRSRLQLIRATKQTRAILWREGNQ